MSRLLFLLVFLSFSNAADAYRHCIADWFCVIKDESQNAIKLENLTDFPVVVTLDAVWNNAKGKKQRVSITRQLTTRDESQFYIFDSPINQLWASLHYNAAWAGGIENAVHDASWEYQLPFDKSEHYSMVQGFNGGFSHYGESRYAVDFAMPVGTPIYAARGGVVIDTEHKFNQGGSSRRYAAYANYIVILHKDGTTGEYYHLKQHGVVVARGQHIKEGQLIGYSGNTGFSSLPHLHFAVYQARAGGKYQSLPFKFASNT